MKQKLTLAIVTLTLCSIVQADTQIETTDKRGERSTFTSNGKVARIDHANSPEYVLVDLKQQLFKMVDSRRQQVMVMDIKGGQKSASATTSRVRVDLNKAGNGPKIAGYSTEKYTLSANGKLCNTIYGSKSVMNKKGISELFDAMNVMQQQTRNMMGGFRPMMDACTEANLQSAELLKTTGAPLRMVDANGQLESEVTAINSNAKMSSDYYQIPANYQQVSMQQQMNQSMQQMQQNMPDMNQIMQQMQQSGIVPPPGMQRPQRMPPPGVAPGGSGEMSDLLKQIEEMQKMKKQ